MPPWLKRGTTKRTKLGTMFEAGSIVTVPYPFSDQSRAKRRPVLALTGPDPWGDFIGCPMTSRDSWLNARPIGDDNPAGLLARFSIGGDGDPDVALLGIGQGDADVPAGGVDSGKLGKQTDQALALEGLRNYFDVKVGSARARDRARPVHGMSVARVHVGFVDDFDGGGGKGGL